MSSTVLIVDPDPQSAAALARQLGDEFPVEVANSGEEALERLEAGARFAVAVCDRRLPRMRSSEFLGRASELAADMVTVLLSEQADVDVAIEALHRGRIFRFVEKPCPRAALLDALRAAVAEHGQRAARRELSERLDFTAQVLQVFNSELDDRLNRQSTSLAELQRFVAALGHTRDLDQVARLAAEACTTACPLRGVLVELWTGEGESERVRVSGARTPGERRYVRPIETAEGQNGMLVLDSQDELGVRLSRDERAFLAAIASTTGVAVHNEVRRLQRDEAQHATILALAKLAEQRDNETGKHLERVSLFCRLIAEGLREYPEFTDEIDDAFVRDLERSAPLHDIGKVGIPDSILLKPGKLDREEWRIMQTHTTIGADTLSSAMVGTHGSGFLGMARDIAWCHHERWDGGGYPRGLRGEQIPLSARILTLADVYDALTSVRPYKEAWSHTEAMQAIVSGIGTQFDERTVRVLLQRQLEADSIRERLADSLEDAGHRVALAPR